jgi:NDP-sugar pyrophosphorylase family protein
MKIVALVLAGGEGTRLYPLTAEHAKPALPFANGYRIVDFVLSNLVNSGIATIYVVAQYKPDSLVRHIQSAWAPSFEGSEGLIKVLLQLQHKTLVKSLHCEELNPYLQLEDSPFYIVREHQAWRPLQDAKGRDLPRRTTPIPPRSGRSTRLSC